MRTVFRSALWLALVAAILSSAPLGGASKPTKKLLTYDQVWGVPAGPPAPDGPGQGGILGQLPVVTGWADDGHYLEVRTDPADKQRKVFKVSAADGTAVVARDLAAIQKDLPEGFTVQAAVATSADQNRMVWERSGDLFLFDATTKAFRQLTASSGIERNARFSPDGTLLAYTRDNNLYAYDIGNNIERQFTADGSDTIYNGWASWVYFEEILGRSSKYAAFWWSPDSTKLAFMRFDDSPVPVFPIYHADGQHGELERQRYPKAGDPNPWVRMGVVSVANGTVTWMDFDEKADHYLAWPVWTTDSKTLTVQWMNRGQDRVRFYNCQPATGKKTMIFEEKQASWVEWFEDISYLKDGGFLVRSSVDGWEHLYLYNGSGTLRTRLTSGNWRVNAIELVDETNGYVYFTGRPLKSWDAQLMRVKLDGTGLTTLTTGDGIHRSQVSPGGTYFIDTVSTAATPAVMTLRRIDGTALRELGTQRTPAMAEYAWGKTELFTIPSDDGQFQLPALWVVPPDFDPKNTKKRYPVIFAIYGGPDAGGVQNAWRGLQPHYWAERGVITIGVDHRGSGHFGKKGVALMHRKLGTWEMADLIAATKWLRSKPFIAKDKIAITGGSYGGYTTHMAMTFGAGSFNYGIAASSVTDWQLYDSVYTERYMDTPQENPEGYKNGAVLTWIDRYTGGLRITHGTIDDNVHMQNSMQVVDWLTSHNKPFELMLYPDSRHGFQASQRPHDNRATHDYWMRVLLGK